MRHFGAACRAHGGPSDQRAARGLQHEPHDARADVSSGAGITLLPSMAVPVESRRGQLEVRPFAKLVPGRTVALVWRPRSSFAAVFIELAKAFGRATG